jgi:hypothetical protein
VLISPAVALDGHVHVATGAAAASTASSCLCLTEKGAAA